MSQTFDAATPPADGAFSPAPRPPQVDVIASIHETAPKPGERAWAPPPETPSAFELAVPERLKNPQVHGRLSQFVDNFTSGLEKGETATFLFICPETAYSLAGALTVAAALLAATGDNVLLIDGSATSGGLSALLERANRSGLSESIKRGQIDQAAILPLSLPNVFLLPSGRPSGVGKGQPPREFATMLSSVSPSFPIVLIDGGVVSSPLAQSLAAVSDQIYLGVGLGRTRRAEARRAAALLQSWGGHLLGCVAVDPALG